MKCNSCGAEMQDMAGGIYYCPNCQNTISDLLYRPHSPNNCDMPLPQGFGVQYGWICPKCGRVNAPHVNYCPCSSNGSKITYGSGVTCESSASVLNKTK